MVPGLGPAEDDADAGDADAGEDDAGEDDVEGDGGENDEDDGNDDEDDEGVKDDRPGSPSYRHKTKVITGGESGLYLKNADQIRFSPERTVPEPCQNSLCWICWGWL
jgi:hypothetical protein